MISERRRGTRVVFRLFSLCGVFVGRKRGGLEGDGSSRGNQRKWLLATMECLPQFNRYDSQPKPHWHFHMLLHAPNEQGRTLSRSITDWAESGDVYASPALLGIEPVVSVLFLSILNKCRRGSRDRNKAEKQIFQASCLYEGKCESSFHRRHLQLFKSIQTPAWRCRKMHWRFWLQSDLSTCSRARWET